MQRDGGGGGYRYNRKLGTGGRGGMRGGRWTNILRRRMLGKC